MHDTNHTLPNNSASSMFSKTFHTWKSLHKRLASLLDEYLDACLDLASQPPDCGSWAGLQPMLLQVGTALSELEKSSMKMQRAQKTLGTVRNRATSLVPINILPAEIITHIFALVNDHCMVDQTYGHGFKKSRPFILSRISIVSKHWYSLSLEPSLWSHIDLTIGGSQDNRHLLYGRSALQRARQLPLHVHIFQIDVATRRILDPDMVIALLAPVASRIVSFRLKADLTLICSIIRGVFSYNTPSSLKECYLHDSHGHDGEELGDDVLGLFFADAPGPLRVFNLGGPLIPLRDFALSGLTELKLTPFITFTPTPLQVTGVLSACPELRSLALTSLRLDNNLEATVEPVFLPRLEVLDLRGAYTNDLPQILSLIAFGSTPLSFSMSVDGDTSVEELCQLRPFLRQSSITRLCVEDQDKPMGDVDVLFEFLADDLPFIKELALSDYELTGAGLQKPLSAESFPCLHTLHLLGCGLNINTLCGILAPSVVQVVQLDPKRVTHRGRYSHFARELSAFVPSVRCYEYHAIDEGEPGLEWPLRLS